MKSYHNGPVKDQSRSCTDLYCFILFVLFNISLLAVAIYAWTNGNFQKLTTPYDSDSKPCGVNQLLQYPYIYFVSPHSDTLWKTVCVKQCPKENDTTVLCSPNSVVTHCSGNNIEIYQTISIRGTLCLPSQTKIKEQLYGALGIQQIDAKISNLKHSVGLILLSVLISVILSVIFMFIIRFTSGFFVYVITAITFIALFSFGVYMIIPHQNQFIVISGTRAASIAIGIVSIFLSVTVILGFICFNRRIVLAVSITKVAAQFVNSNLFMILLPVALFLLMMIFVSLWFLQALGFYSLGVPADQQTHLPFKHFQITLPLRILGAVHIFYLLWGLIFLIESGDFIVSGAACSWYFQSQSPYLQSNARFRNFHIGSVCIGSFLLALFGFIKFLQELLAPQQEKDGCQLIWKKFCDCCFFVCVTYIFQCFNSGAYTIIHLSGDGYCVGAWQAISLKVRQPVSTGVVLFMETVFSIFVKIGIVILTCLICYLLMQNYDPWKSQIIDETFPLIIIGIISFSIGSFFVSLYSEAMNSIYVSYLADCQAGGSVSQDKAPDQLKIFLQTAKQQNHFQ